ncbi:MAG TPA: hypothetical protein VK448_08690 [Dissulfurispiraceae bacterium]|nr:hypothetical protein [Dissulfurispiraceae bacterium]
MERSALRTSLCIICLTIIIAIPASLKADEKNSEHHADRKAIAKELKNTLGMPILKGDTWQMMSQESKIAFIWGFGHVVAIEQHLMDKYPELRREDFVAKVIEGMAGIPMNDVISRIDSYYAANQDEIETPVVSVIWQTMIKPNIKTGINGRPLN